jgi:hypothetical protein
MLSRGFVLFIPDGQLSKSPFITILPIKAKLTACIEVSARLTFSSNALIYMIWMNRSRTTQRMHAVRITLQPSIAWHDQIAAFIQIVLVRIEQSIRRNKPACLFAAVLLH